MADGLRRVFVDTSALYAVLNAGDPAAPAVRRALDDPALSLVTHTLVAVELVVLVTRRLGFDAARRVIDDVLPRLEIAVVDPDLLDLALGDFRASGSGSVSIVDRASFAFMRREGLRTAVAIDADFRTQGFEVLPE